MAPLDAALALAQCHHAPVGVGEHLDLDVTRSFEILLQVDLARPEGLLRLALHCREGRLELPFRADQANSLAAPAGGRLEQHGVPLAGLVVTRLGVIYELSRRTG